MSAAEQEAIARAEVAVRGVMSEHFGGGQWDQSKPRFAPAAKEAVAAAIAELPGFKSGREAERADVVAEILKRSRSVANLAKHGRLTEADAHRLKRWLGALAEDIETGLHEGD